MRKMGLSILYSVLLTFSFCRELHGNCLIAKANNIILQKKEIYLEQHRQASIFNIPYSSPGYDKEAQIYIRDLAFEKFIGGGELYGKRSEWITSITNSYQSGCFLGWTKKGNRQIVFVNYIEDGQEGNSSTAKHAKGTTKAYLSPLVEVECGYKDLLKEVPNIYAEPIKKVIAKSFSKKEIDNIKFKKLLGGLSQSKLFQIKSGNKKYVLRLLDKDKTIEIRKSEISAHIIGSNLKIAPDIISTDPLSLAIIMDFIEGRTMSTKDLEDTALIEKIINNLKKFHNYCIDGNYLLNQTKLDELKKIYGNYSKNGAVYPSGYDEIYQKLQEDFIKLDRAYLPSHGDFNPANILIAKDGNIYFIDWAEARIDNPLLDIGWLAACTGADVHQTKSLLKVYFGREPTTSEFKEVLYFKKVTNFLVATILIGEQEEKDQTRLDSILKMPIKKSSEYKKEGITVQEIASQKGQELTIYALGWLKEVIDIQLYIESIDECPDLNRSFALINLASKFLVSHYRPHNVFNLACYTMLVCNRRTTFQYVVRRYKKPR